MPTIDNPLLSRAGARALIAAGATLAVGAGSAAAAPLHSGSGSPKPAVVPSSPEFLAAGAKGPAVKQLQRALHLQVNGVFGSATKAAVVRFQRRHHLLVDGVVGPQTRRALHLRVRVIPAPTTHVAAPTTASTSSSAQTSSGYSIPSSIVQCESGGNWRAVNPTTGAGGAYQIMPSTWAAYGGSGLPQNASPAQQSAIAAKIWASSGPSAWSC